MKKKYELTTEHRAQLKPWADKWIANALKTGRYTEQDIERCKHAMRGLYSAAGLTPPDNEVFCAGPVSGAIAASIASGVWFLRDNQDSHVKLFGRIVGAVEIEHAAYAAVAIACGIMSPTRAATAAATEAATRAATEAATRVATWAATRVATWAATAAATWAATAAATRDATRDAVEAATRVATLVATRDATAAATWAATEAATWADTRDATLAATDDATWAATRDAVCKFLLLCVGSWERFHDGGNQWSGYASYLSFFRHVAHLPIDYSKWDAVEVAAEFGPRYTHSKFWIVSELPDFIRRDDRRMPHSSAGPFCQWRDGVKLYYWHGVKVPGEWLEDPRKLDAKTALAWHNAEQRRCAAEILGWGAILAELQPAVVDEDSDPAIGTLLEVDLPDAPKEKFLKVMCATGRTFVLPVPAEMQTALQANAWTYGIDSEALRGYEVRT